MANAWGAWQFRIVGLHAFPLWSRSERFKFRAQICIGVLAARSARGLQVNSAPLKRAQGMPDARCTRGLVCMCTKRCAHEHTGQRRQSDIPCAMALRLIARSPR
jgi:hypothetical protein